MSLSILSYWRNPLSKTADQACIGWFPRTKRIWVMNFSTAWAIPWASMYWNRAGKNLVPPLRWFLISAIIPPASVWSSSWKVIMVGWGWTCLPWVLWTQRNTCYSLASMPLAPTLIRKPARNWCYAKAAWQQQLPVYQMWMPVWRLMPIDM